MDQTVHQKLIVRLVALAAVTFSLILVVKQDDQVRLGMAQSMPAFQPQAPVIVVRNEPGSPLVISAERQLPKTEEAPEIAFNVTNVTNKTIIAFAIKMEVASGPKVVAEVSLRNLALSGTDLPPNRSLNSFDSYENLSSEQHRVTLSVDYVLFSDGKRWGVDSVKSAETVAGQQAAAEMVTTRLLKMFREGNTSDVVSVLESMAHIEPPPQHSQEWNAGFRSAASSVANRLKRANHAGGPGQVNSELSRLATKLSREP